MSAQESPPIINPNVYLNYLSTGEATIYEVGRGINLATLGALIWDILSSLPDERKLIQVGRGSTILFAYFLARPSALAMVILTVLEQTGPVSNCRLIAAISAALQIISSAAASYLFLKRVHAVYFGSRSVQYFFSFLWVVGIGTSCLLLYDAVHGYSEIANTKHCIRQQDWAALPVAFGIPVLFDGLVYSAIIHKILSTHQTGQKRGWRTFFYRSSKGLPHFSRAVFEGGQLYYLMTNSINMTRLNFSTSFSMPPSYQVMLSAPTIALTSVMACRVYRNLLITASDEVHMDDRELTRPVFANGRKGNVSLSLAAETVPPEMKSCADGGGESTASNV
ncbi:hypothetical protein F5J12DRAFT_890498 [Pisolithus orientalis]|uniref:uncharacterized protein n=1 Tax=Pisolithus orientalis TaxID=936130 RepID=UPI0022255592|nr:uncharacterized protein F5J12DRAFT_890498 [Pisolithus orientalis]KAI6015148.1 hypothetical protein F5J12DRAFT_890498 [Pisolithus orientalis]